MNSRTVCTIAIARTFAPVSCASAIACASAPGAAANSAESVSQPCTNFRYAITEVVTATIAMVSASMLSGQVTIVATVSGVTDEPSEMPRMT